MYWSALYSESADSHTPAQSCSVHTHKLALVHSSNFGWKMVATQGKCLKKNVISMILSWWSDYLQDRDGQDNSKLNTLSVR